jgi:hypothetical protein
MRNMMAFGLDMSGRLLFPVMDEQAFAEALIHALPQNAGRVEQLTGATAKGASFKGEVERQVLDVGDPYLAGWTFLVNEADPQREDLTRVIKKLAEHRKMEDPEQPLLYHGEPPEEWEDWIIENYLSLQLDGLQVPQYVLILGGPDQVPFHFQSVLNTMAKVGRLCFDPPNALDELERYVEKVMRLEAAPEPAVTRDVVLFAPDGGPQDPTFYSRQYMVEPLAEHLRDDLGFPVQSLLAYKATKKNLQTLLESSNPALVYTASHGLGAMEEPEDFQRAYNGSLCCQHLGPLTIEDLYSAQDVPLDRPFLEGSVFFQFACFGYGTPTDSDYTHWLEGVPEHYTSTDFVAALPKRLLAHPHGPIGYIGHLDTAWLHGFTDADDPAVPDRWHARIAPFVSAVDRLLQVQPSGLSLHDMSGVYSVCNAVITGTYDSLQKGKLVWNPKREARFLDTWIRRSDAQNYMVFGDPGARLRIPAP